ncbi:MAG: hypothetical protein LH702_18085 [Phormidesmis sp. CAN_BIN44]|nr:hypothetical protein [Phormidesmis sp. CAN_BIN44]
MKDCTNSECNDKVDEYSHVLCNRHHRESWSNDTGGGETTDSQCVTATDVLEDSSTKDPYQGFITDKMSAKEGRKTIQHDGLTFGSQSEVAIFKALEERQVLFFLLPLGVRYETGIHCKDRREPDFLVCYEGTWGILEVSYHEPERYEKDEEKDAWFKKSGLLCVEHYTAEACYKGPKRVVEEFLSILIQHKSIVRTKFEQILRLKP